MEENIKELQSLIDDFGKLKIKESTGKTFLQIAKMPHYENVWSNILAFYFNPNNEHKLYDLFLKSLFQLITSEMPDFSSHNIIVKTEYQTSKGNRIDIVVLADNFILGIENKVNASLYNDLSDYSETLKELSNKTDIPPFKVVLSKYKNIPDPNTGFKNITYRDFINALKQNLGAYTDNADSKYLIFLLDFLKNIENNIKINTMENNPELVDFLLKNVDKVNKLVNYHNLLKDDLVKKLDEIDNLIINNENLKTNDIFKGTPTTKKSGRFVWDGHQLIKYCISIGDVILFYQIGIKDYKIHSRFWFKEDKYASYLENGGGINQNEYDYNLDLKEISTEITEQIIDIIAKLNDRILKLSNH